MQRMQLWSAILVCVTLASSVKAQAQPRTNAPSSLSQLAELTASDGTAIDQFATVTAISGNTVVVGAWEAQVGSNKNQGVAYVFVKPTNGWENMTQVAKLTASDGSTSLAFGWSVAISGDTIVVGTDQISGAGAVYVFVKPKSGWKDMTETAELIPGGFEGGYFGYSVGISGKTIVCGVPAVYVGSNFAQGAAFVFIRPRNGWVTTSQFDAELTASDGVRQDSLGWSVAISGDTVAAGAIYADSVAQDQGAAYVFVKPANGWANMTQDAKLTASDGQYQDHLGQSIAIFHDSVVAGVPDRISEHAAYVFVKPYSGWASMTQTAEITERSPDDSRFGASLALSANKLVVGKPSMFQGSQGEAYVFVKPKTGWTDTSKFKDLLKASDGEGQDAFGWSVSISGGRILVGADRFFVNKPGAAYVF